MYNIQLVESMCFHGTTHYVCAHPQCLSVFCSAQHPAAVMTDKTCAASSAAQTQLPLSN